MKWPSSRRPPALAASEHPVHLLMGYLSGVSKKDTLEYARGLAGKYFLRTDMSFVAAYRYADGYVYELQEGGTGKSYFPAILQAKKLAGAATHVVCLPTAERKVRVVLGDAALQCLLLPFADTSAVDALQPSGTMAHVDNLGYGLVSAASVVFVSGFAALLLAGTLFRLTAVDPDLAPTPTGPWQYWTNTGQAVVAHLPPGGAVSALQFSQGRWQLRTTLPGAPAVAGARAVPPGHRPLPVPRPGAHP